MTPRLSICVPYYRNPDMLAEQFGVWTSYPPALKSAIEIVLVDDGSPEPAIDVPRPDTLPALRIYRVQDDIPWHQHGARNLAATVAEAPWLLLTDMDHVAPASSLSAVLETLAGARAGDVFTFGRVDAPDGRQTVDDHGNLKPHCNSFAIEKAHFWAVGGYDEDCVGYGTDGYFRGRLWSHPATHRVHLHDIPLVRYPREVIADANTRPPKPMDPKVFRDSCRRSDETRRRLRQKQARNEGPTVLAFTWERAL